MRKRYLNSSSYLVENSKFKYVNANNRTINHRMVRKTMGVLKLLVGVILLVGPLGLYAYELMGGQIGMGIHMWKSLGIDIQKEMSFFCGSGWRAAEVLVYSKVMGLDNTSLYSDGWMGWSNNPSGLPIESGK